MGASSSKSDLTDLDLARFAGQWHLIGKTRCQHDIKHESATFDFKLIQGSDNKEYQLTKTCLTPDPTSVSSDASRQWGLRVSKVEMGVVHKVGKTELEIKFEYHPHSLDVNVIWTDYDNFAVLVSKRGHLWILSRRAVATREELTRLRLKAVHHGFNPKMVDLTPNGSEGLRTVVAPTIPMTSAVPAGMLTPGNRVM
jgi:lipocalin